MRLTVALTASSIIVALVCAIGWFHEHRVLHDVRHAFAADTLDPVVEMLNENAALVTELQSAPYAEGDNEFVSAYLIKIRRDGFPKNSNMRQRIDRVIDNNTAILALLAKYSTHSRTPAFRASAERFRTYAICLRDRWQSVPEIFMAGGNLPAAGPLFPADFPQATAAEAR